MNITKENLLKVINEFGSNLYMDPSCGSEFDSSINSKLDRYCNDPELFKNSLDKNFATIIENNRKRMLHFMNL